MFQQSEDSAIRQFLELEYQYVTHQDIDNNQDDIINQYKFINPDRQQNHTQEKGLQYCNQKSETYHKPNCELQLNSLKQIQDLDATWLNKKIEQIYKKINKLQKLQIKSRPQYKKQENKKTLDIELQDTQEKKNLNAKKMTVKKYSNKDCVKYVSPLILTEIKLHTSNSNIKYTSKNQKYVQNQQLIKIQLSHEQCALTKKFQKIHRKPNKDQFRQLCGLITLSKQKKQYQMDDSTDHLRALILNYLRSGTFIKEMIKKQMSFNKKLSSIKKCSILQRFPVEPWKINNFDELS